MKFHLTVFQHSLRALTQRVVKFDIYILSLRELASSSVERCHSVIFKTGW